MARPYFDFADVSTEGAEYLGYYEDIPLNLPYSTDLVAAYIIHASFDYSKTNLANPGTFDLTEAGTDDVTYYVGAVGGLFTNTAFFNTGMTASANQTLIGIADCIHPANSSLQSAVMSSYDGVNPVGDEIGFTAGSAAMTGEIAGNTLTVSSPTGAPLDVGATVFWTITGTTYNDTITALAGGTGGAGNYTLANAHTVAAQAMTALSPNIRVIAQCSASGNQTSTVSTATTAIGSPILLAGTMDSSGGATVSKSYKGVGGVITAGTVNLVASARSPITDANTIQLGRSREAAARGSNKIRFAARFSRVLTLQQITDNHDYLREDYLPKYGTPATW